MHQLLVTRSMLYVERVPNVWVPVMAPAVFLALSWPDRRIALDRAVKTGKERDRGDIPEEGVVYPRLDRSDASDSRRRRPRLRTEPRSGSEEGGRR